METVKMGNVEEDSGGQSAESAGRGQRLHPLAKPFYPQALRFNPSAPVIPRVVQQEDKTRFFIIRTTSMPDLQRSMENNMWRSSCLEGLETLNAAFTGGYRIYLLFSVFGSKRFSGVAEMSGPIDPSKCHYFVGGGHWDKTFPIVWHVKKNVPNRRFVHLRMENNEPVTSARDLQEVHPGIGYNMLAIFENQH